LRELAAGRKNLIAFVASTLVPLANLPARAIECVAPVRESERLFLARTGVEVGPTENHQQVTSSPVGAWDGAPRGLRCRYERHFGRRDASAVGGQPAEACGHRFCETRVRAGVRTHLRSQVHCEEIRAA